jgi:hypothetical protein
MGGIIMGAIGGLGDAAQNVGSTFLKNELDTESRLKVNQQDSDLALARSKALEDYKIQAGNTQREQQASRISTAAQPIVEQGIVNRARAGRANQLPEYDPSDTTGPASFHGDAKEVLAAIRALPEGPDKQAALAQLQRQVDAGIVKNAGMKPGDLTDEERTKFAPSDSDLTKARTRAAIESGDISPKDAATLDQKGEADLTKLMLGDQRMQTMSLIASGHDETRKLVAGMMAASRRANADKEDRVIVHQFLSQFDRKITENGKEIRSLRNSLGNVTKKEDKQSIMSQIGDLQVQNQRLSKAQIEYARDAGVKVPSMDPEGDGNPPAPAPAPGAPVTKPPLNNFFK